MPNLISNPALLFLVRQAYFQRLFITLTFTRIIRKPNGRNSPVSARLERSSPKVELLESGMRDLSRYVRIKSGCHQATMQH